MADEIEQRACSEIERSLKVAAEAPIEAAAMIADAEQAVKALLSDLRGAIAADPGCQSRPPPRDPHTGVPAFRPRRPGRWLVTEAMDLSRRLATPAGFEPALPT